MEAVQVASWGMGLVTLLSSVRLYINARQALEAISVALFKIAKSSSKVVQRLPYSHNAIVSDAGDELPGYTRLLARLIEKYEV